MRDHDERPVAAQPPSRASARPVVEAKICDLALIVVTHGHIDHFGSAAELHRLTGAPIAGHVADVEPFRSGRARTRLCRPAPWAA
ncbi:MBL fold metallo-hydrolase [Streptomyces sp. NPDC046557]|uniref:MBL fold metallo-hydrolase n=1 Tax=Streptomyces sp. NPDC046557 TaxID=3155372 RepID=UPI00340E1E0F